MKQSEYKMTVYKYQLENIFDLAEKIANLDTENTAFALGQAMALATNIKESVQDATHGRVGGKKGGEKSGS
ncbi:hypothetical protein [Schleiferilactobacillus harbinensis]|uniref:hypothetical protein n=1 Tax=Schleiferilactobacillus harbinensis TaxID=304207 RepID=UPI00116FE9D7|nr:hypothetical protein [Schleiferilactobacillus harbinensis]GEK06121.1 hypothetical protein LHA01_13600 [Schleiferilactobacillus harbinensis]